VPLKEALDSTAAGRYVELLNGQQSSGNAYLANALVTAINNGQVQEVGNVLAATQAKAKPAPSASAPATPVKKQSPVMPSV